MMCSCVCGDRAVYACAQQLAETLRSCLRHQSNTWRPSELTGLPNLKSSECSFWNRLKVECQEDVCMAADISSRRGLMTSLPCHNSPHASQIITVVEGLGKTELEAGTGTWGRAGRQGSANRWRQNHLKGLESVWAFVPGRTVGVSCFPHHSPILLNKGHGFTCLCKSAQSRVAGKDEIPLGMEACL